MAIDAKKLIYFASVIENGSLKRAAATLGLTQPALSMSMDKLESELNIRLLDRSRAGVMPTAAGETLCAHARLVRRALIVAERDVLESVGRSKAGIRVGCLQSLAESLMPEVLARWREAYPDTELRIIQSAQIDLLTGVLQREFDFVIGYTECHDIEDGLKQRVLFRDRLRVIARPDHPLANLPAPNWSDIVRFPWVGPASRRPYSVLEKALAKAGVSPPDKFTFCGSASLNKALVASSDHLALLPEHAIRKELQESRLISLPMDDPALNRNIAVFFMEGYEVDADGQHLVDLVGSLGRSLCRDPSEDMGPDAASK
jgi:DNA-binding transcriptional LysR family regulator